MECKGSWAGQSKPQTGWMSTGSKQPISACTDWVDISLVRERERERERETERERERERELELENFILQGL